MDSNQSHKRESRKIGFQELAPYVRLVQHIEGDDRYRLPPRIIYDYELIYVVAGHCDYEIEGADYPLAAGDLLFMPPLVRHSCTVPAGEKFHYYAVHFDLAYMGESFDFSVDEVYTSHDYLHAPYIPDEPELTDRPVVRLAEVEFPYVFAAQEPLVCEALLRAMYRVHGSESYGKELQLRADMLSLLAVIVRQLATPSGISRRHPQSERIQQAVQWMKVNYRMPIQLADIAASVHLSPSHFRALFKEATGKSPMEMLLVLRMERAKELLLHSELSVGQIAEEVGYADLHYFSRLFKKSEGMSPVQYAQSLRPKFR